MTTTKPELLTADDLLRLYSEGVRGELIHQPNGSTITLTDDDRLNGGDVLPSFTCEVSDVFTD